MEAAEMALPRSLYAVQLRKEDLLVGMGRIIGDLGCFVQICDIAVHPDFQGQGLSKIIMEHVMTFIKNEVPRSCWVNLFADVDFLYQKFGFVSPREAKGMCLDWNKFDDWFQTIEKSEL